MGRAIINSSEIDIVGGMRDTVIKWRLVLLTYSSNANRPSWLVVINLRMAIDGVERWWGRGTKARWREKQSRVSVQAPPCLGRVEVTLRCWPGSGSGDRPGAPGLLACVTVKMKGT